MSGPPALPANLDPKTLPELLSDDRGLPVARRRAAWRGALLAGFPAVGMAFLAPSLHAWLIPSVAHLASAWLPSTMAPYALLAVLLAAPAVLAIPVGLLAARAARTAARRDRDEGLAAAAGAGMAASAVAMGAVLQGASSASELALRAPLLAAAGLATGIVGSFAFAALPRARRGESEEGVPDLYHGMLAAGIGAPALLTGAAAWAATASLFPVLSPRVVQGFLSSPFAEVATAALALGGLAPVTYAVARVLGGGKSEARRKAVALGLLATVMVPAVSLVGLALGHGSMAAPIGGLIAGCLMAVAPHAAALGAALLGPGSDRRRRALPAAEVTAAAPAVSAQPAA